MMSSFSLFTLRISREKTEEYAKWGTQKNSTLTLLRDILKYDYLENLKPSKEGHCVPTHLVFLF